MAAFRGAYPKRGGQPGFHRRFARRSRQSGLHLRAGSLFAGLIGFKSADPACGSIEIGYWLREEFQHRGIVTAAVQELRRIAFEELGMRRIEIRCATGNLPSNRIPQRLGMRLDRVEKQAELLSSGERIDLNVYVAEK